MVHRIGTASNPGGLRFRKTHQWAQVDHDIRDAIQAIVWPPGTDSFIIPPVKHGNGVPPIKKAFTLLLSQRGWLPEQRMALVGEVRPGPVDAIFDFPDGTRFLVEWETGNISSSHRSINRLLCAITTGIAVGGALVVARRETLYPYLTDRVGNDRELRPCFKLWASYPMPRGLLAIYVVDLDALHPAMKPIPKGTDGWALIQRKVP